MAGNMRLLPATLPPPEGGSSETPSGTLPGDPQVLQKPVLHLLLGDPSNQNVTRAKHVTPGMQSRAAWGKVITPFAPQQEK